METAPDVKKILDPPLTPWIIDLWSKCSKHCLIDYKKKIEKTLKACKSFNPVILDKTKQSIVIQITALRREIDKMGKKLKPFGLTSTSRTGAIAMTRGAEVFK